jgi:HlyD family secretion protein
MRTLLIVGVVVALFAGAIAAGYSPALEYWQKQNAPKWRTSEVSQGDIVSVVNSTGTIKPVLQVAIGSFVSGPIIEPKDEHGNPLLDRNGKPWQIAAFNQEVKKGDLLAKVDPRIYQASYDRDLAILQTRQADVERVDALLQQAINDERRADELRKEDPNFIAQAEIDKFHFTRLSLKAQLDLQKASVAQARAQLDLSLANLKYTDIRAPVDGIIINRKIDPGQTLAAQFQTPELFVLAPEMREKMHVHASVDEADIGYILEAKKRALPVTFTVDAYSDLFEGVIEEVRLSSTTTQNVVTYPVIVAAPNPELKLLPGMTASISFEVERRDDVVKVPNSALRFFPQVQHVRPEDKPLLEGKQDVNNEEEQVTESSLAASERAAARKKRNRRHVWVQEGIKLKAVEVETGISDSYFTELVSGDLKPGAKLVIGLQANTAGFGG